MSLRGIVKQLDNQFDRSQIGPLPDVDKVRSLIATINMPRGGGKTTLLLSLLQDKRALKKKFDNIFLISGTAATTAADKKMKKLMDEVQSCGNFNDEFCEAFLDQMYQRILKENAEDNNARHLLILDDVVTEIPKKDSGTFARLITNSRHLNLSIIVLSQRYLRLPPILRANSDIIVMGRTMNAREFDGFMGDANVSQPVLRRVYGQAMQVGSHPFLWVNMQGSPITFWNSNFDQIPADDIFVV